MPHNENKPVMYSALEVAKLCGVVNQTAINWIRNNHLKAFNTPGGQFRVYPEDLVEFMKSRNIQIPAELRAACYGESYIPRSILIVDDDRGLNSVVAKFLSKRIENLGVFQAFDGFEAGSLMTEKLPGIVILDLDLPGIDGFDLCRRINSSEKFGKPAIIVITALENDEVESKVNELGVNCFMKKPLNLANLVDTINGIL
ncbi:MAG: response regulator [Treponema sp.]|nr:response regulator [Treponema sp.]